MNLDLDNQQIKSFKKGKNCILSNMYELYAAMLALVAYRYLQCTEDAKDAVMDVFEKLANMDDEKRQQLIPDNSAHFKSWLISVTKNHSLDIIKHKKIIERYQSDIQSNEKHSQSDVERKWDKQTIDYVISQLLESEQRIANLHYSGYSNDEIANKLNISYNTVRNQLSVAKKKIRKYISPLSIVLILNIIKYVSL